MHSIQARACAVGLAVAAIAVKGGIEVLRDAKADACQEQEG